MTVEKSAESVQTHPRWRGVRYDAPVPKPDDLRKQ